MFFSSFLAIVCGIPFLMTVLLISLLLMILDCVLYEKRSAIMCVHILDRVFRYGEVFRSSSHKYLNLACLALLLIYPLIPMGSLKVYLDTPTDTIFMVMLLLLAQSLYVRGIRNFSSNIYLELDDFDHNAISRFTLCFITACSSMMFYMLARGTPGDIMSLESFTAMPYWTIAGRWGFWGCVCFFLLFAITYPGRGAHSLKHYPEAAILDVYGALRASIGPAVTVAMFFPWNPAVLLKLNRVAMYSFDYAFFWLKVALLQLLVFPSIRKLYSKMEKRLPENTGYLALISLGLAGVAALYADFVFE